MNDRTPGDTSAFDWMFFFVAGGVTGVSVALLLAPQAGRRTRERMRRKLSDTGGFGRDLKNRLTRRGKQIRDEARRRVDDAISPLEGDGGKSQAGQDTGLR